MNHLSIGSLDVKDAQKRVIQQILDEKRARGEIKSDEEYQAVYDEWVRKIVDGEMSFTFRPQEGLTNPRAFNETQTELFIDLMTLFHQIQRIEEALVRHQQLNQSIVGHLKLQANRLSDELRRYEEMLAYGPSTEMVLETFRDANSFESNTQYLTERDGMLLSPSYQARLNMERKAITLPTILTENALIGPAGVKLARIRIGKQLGGDLLRLANPDHRIENAVDESLDTFWQETILVDSPLRVQMDERFYYIQHGALCELFLDFDYLTPINEISFLPFTEFPLDVVAIEYFETDDPEEVPKVLVSPDQPDGMKSRAILEGASYQFPDVLVKRMRILLNQRHYVKTDYLIQERDEQEKMLWTLAQNQTPKEGFVNLPLYQDQNETMALSLLQEEKDQTKGKPVTKYLYSYGLYNIGIRRNEYQDKGIYVSKPLVAEGNIKQVSLEVEEEHPIVPELQLVFTDIEYYITHKEQPKPEDWIPILPKNKSRVEAERLFLRLEEGKYLAHLRFPPKPGTVVVRRNGIALSEALGEYSINGQTVMIHNVDISAIYTASYEPEETAYQIDFVKLHTKNGKVEPNFQIETFQGTNPSGEIQLRYFPFVDRARLNVQPENWNPTYLSNDYLPIKVKLIDKTGLHIDQPYSPDENDIVVVVNRTNYFEPEKSQLDAFDTSHMNYQYVVQGNRIRFNTTIPETTRIIVEYPYLVGQLRLKAILRRNLPTFNGLTPVLNEYRLYYQTLR